MEFQVSDGEMGKKILEAQIPAEELGFAVRQAGKKMAGRLSIPGFRKGKAPQNIIENFVGLDAVLNEAANDLIPRVYLQGIQELALIPVEQPQIEIVQLLANEPLIFKATFTVKPQVKLGQYKQLAVTLQVREVSDEEIEADLEVQRRRLSRLMEAEEGAEAAIGDVLSIDFEGFRDSVPFNGGQAEKYPLELGSHSFIPGFEEQLIGIKVGEEREVNVVFPKNYQDENLADQAAMFKVKAQGLQRRVLPELDDEFIAEVSETAENMADLRLEIAERLLSRNSESAQYQAKENAVAQAAANADIFVPPLMIEERIDTMIQQMSERLNSQGLKMEQFLEYTQQTLEEMRDKYAPQAEKDIRCDLVLEAVAKEEEISVSDEEVEEELEKLAFQYTMPLEQIKETFSDLDRRSILIDDLKMRKAANLIYASAEIEEVVTKVESV
ncbi:MAG: trigger factor [Clostridiales bacterium]|nr:trigger factor [Clostridiales bacterium]